MKDVEKFEKFEEMKKSQESKKPIPEKTNEMVEEFIQLLKRNATSEVIASRLREI